MAGLSEAIQLLRVQMLQNGIQPDKGLGKELFLFASSLVPVVNVDLLVYNSKGQFLLTKRNDPYCGVGWHIPGGCIRYREKAEGRIRKVAKEELGILDLAIEKDPFKVIEFEITDDRPIDNQDERAHFITLAYRCHVSDTYVIDNHGLSEDDIGYVKWFDHLPDDFLQIQDKYRQILK
jgi:colanic acid biosynthesis protein WcaH